MNGEYEWRCVRYYPLTGDSGQRALDLMGAEGWEFVGPQSISKWETFLQFRRPFQWRSDPEGADRD